MTKFLLPFALVLAIVDVYLLNRAKHTDLDRVRRSLSGQRDSFQEAIWARQKKNQGKLGKGFEIRKRNNNNKEAQPLVNENQKTKAPLIDLSKLTELQVNAGKGQIFEILRQAGIDYRTLTKTQRYRLPTWAQVTKLYGERPHIVGLETCRDYNRLVLDKSMAFYGAAGVFNSGTNLLAQLLIKNCQIVERMEKYGYDSRGMRWQVPWG